MRVLLVFHEISFRGGEKLFVSLAKGLTDKGHYVYFIVGRVGKNPRPIPSNVKLVKPHLFINKLFQNNWLFVLLSLPVTFVNVMRIAPKVNVIYSGESFSVLWPSVIAAGVLGKKLVLSVFELGSQKTGFLHTLFVKTVTHAVTINKTLALILKKRFGIANVVYIPAGIDLHLFKNPNPKPIINRYKLSDKKVLFMPGLINPHKRQDLAIKILAEVKKSLPKTILMIAGGGEKQYLFKLKKLAKRLNLQKDVIFTGFVPETRLKHYYAAADMVLMCGPIAGLTIIEALLVSKMPIYPTSGDPPLGPIEEYGVGFVVRSKKPTEYAQKIIDYFKNHRKYQEKLERDRRLVKKQFSLENFTNKTFEVLKNA